MDVWISLAQVATKFSAGAYQVTDVVSDFEFAIGSGALSMHDTLRNPLTVEVSKQVDQMKILEQQRAILADSLRALGVRYL